MNKLEEMVWAYRDGLTKAVDAGERDRDVVQLAGMRAALAALREPSEAMINEMHSYDFCQIGEKSNGYKFAKGMWQAGIDAVEGCDKLSQGDE